MSSSPRRLKKVGGGNSSPTLYKRLLSWNDALKNMALTKSIDKNVFERNEQDDRFDEVMEGLEPDAVRGIVGKIKDEFASANNTPINLSSQNIRGLAAELVGRCLKTAKCSDLNLSDNHLQDVDLQNLTKYLSTPKSSLHMLNLSNNRIGIAGAKTIAKLLKYNNTLKDINIDTNAICASGIEDIAQALASNHSVESFSANWNPLEVFAEEFYFTLIKNSTLLTLKLGYCNLKDTVAEALAHGLESNSSLQELFLLGNEITDDGACALCVSLNQNYNLKYLNLRSNLITDEAGNEFVNLLEDKRSRNQKFVVNLSDNKLSVEVENEIQQNRMKTGRKKTELMAARVSISRESVQSQVNDYGYINNRFYQIEEEDSEDEYSEEGTLRQSMASVDYEGN